jgi:hypothetical protein
MKHAKVEHERRDNHNPEDRPDVDGGSQHVGTV